MPAKGSKHCCCDGCHYPPYDPGVTGEGAVQPVQQYCCGCLPLLVCVTAECSSGATAAATFTRDCSGDAGDYIAWSGTLGIDGTDVDLQFRFSIVDGECRFCVTSTELGLDADDACQTIDAAARGAPDFFCRALNFDGNAWTEWTFNASALCGSGETLTITVAGEALIAITGRPHCLDGEGNLVYDDHPIRDLCGGCGCLCSCACLTVVHNGTGSSGVVCLGEDSVTWTDGNVSVGLVEGEDGCCYLSITDEGDLDLADTPTPIKVGDLANPCPSPVAEWDLLDNSGKPVLVTWRCAECESCRIIPTGCCPNKFPAALTATLNGGLTCTCATTTVILVYDEVFSAWIGFIDGDFCGHDLTLTLTCDGTNWQLSFVADPCVVGSVTRNSVSCDPVSLVFTVNISGGIGCCGPLDFGGAKTITVTITE